MDGATTRAQVLERLKVYYSQVSVEVDDANSWYDPTPANAVSGWKSALKVYAALMLRLDTNGDLGVAAMYGGQVQHDFWIANAKNVAAGLSNIMEAMGESRFTWSRFYDEVVVESAVQAAAVPGKVVSTTVAQLGPQTYVLVGLVVVGLIAVAVIKVG